MNIDQHKQTLETIYAKYNKPEFIHPDPLEFVIKSKPEDKEIVALIASSLAVGRVNSILKTVQEVLSKIPSPKKNLLTMEYKNIKEIYKNFKYRFYKGAHIAGLLYGIKKCLTDYSSLYSCFKSGIDINKTNYIDALNNFAKKINQADKNAPNMLPLPENGSACKRLNLFLRWMIRKDEVDPGSWDLPKEKLLIPLDTHMHKLAKKFNFTTRVQSDIKTVIEITESFNKINPKDPVKYDFCLTRLGIHPDLDYTKLANSGFVETC